MKKSYPIIKINNKDIQHIIKPKNIVFFLPKYGISHNTPPIIQPNIETKADMNWPISIFG